MNIDDRMDGCICANGAKVAEIVHPYCPAHAPPEMEADLASLRAELAEANRLRSEALSTFKAREDAIERAEKRATTAEMERDAAIAERDARPDITRGVADLMTEHPSQLTMIDCEIRDAGYAALRAHAKASGGEHV